MASEPLDGQVDQLSNSGSERRVGELREAKAERLLEDPPHIRECLEPPLAVSFAEAVRRAYFGRVSLSATGYYATPGIHWDRIAGRGRPFHYFACGAAVTEVEIDGFTGMMRHLYDPLQYEFLKPMAPWNVLVTLAAIALFGAQLLFIGNFFWSLWRGPQVSEQDPWQANTLEWTTPSPPPHGNWPGPIPEVHRGPYEFGALGERLGQAEIPTPVAG